MTLSDIGIVARDRKREEEVDNYGLLELYQAFLSSPDCSIKDFDINSDDLSDNDIIWFTQLIQVTDNQSAQGWKEGIRFAQVPRKNINKYIREQLTYRAIFDYLEKRKACVAKGCEKPKACDSKKKVLSKFFDELNRIERIAIDSSRESSSAFFIIHDTVLAIALSFIPSEVRCKLKEDTTTPLTLRLLVYKLPRLGISIKDLSIDALYSVMLKMNNTLEFCSVVAKYEEISKILLGEFILQGIKQSLLKEVNAPSLAWLMYELHTAIMRLSILEDAKSKASKEKTQLSALEKGAIKTAWVLPVSFEKKHQFWDAITIQLVHLLMDNHLAVYSCLHKKSPPLEPQKSLTDYIEKTRGCAEQIPFPIENGLHKLVSDAIAERVNRYSLSRKENDQAELTTDQSAVRVYRP